MQRLDDQTSYKSSLYVKYVEILVEQSLICLENHQHT